MTSIPGECLAGRSSARDCAIHPGSVVVGLEPPCVLRRRPPILTAPSPFRKDDMARLFFTLAAACVAAGRMSRGENLPAKNERFPTQACTLVGLGPLEAALTRGGLWHGAADLGSWSSLWLACLCPISQCSGALVRRDGFWRARPLRAGFLRPWFWYGLFAVWLWERGVLWSVPTRPIRLSRSREAGLRRQAGCLRRHCSGLCSEASSSGSLESGLPSRVATRLVRIGRSVRGS